MLRMGFTRSLPHKSSAKQGKCQKYFKLTVPISVSDGNGAYNGASSSNSGVDGPSLMVKETICPTIYHIQVSSLKFIESMYNFPARSTSSGRVAWSLHSSNMENSTCPANFQFNLSGIFPTHTKPSFFVQRTKNLT